MSDAVSVSYRNLASIAWHVRTDSVAFTIKTVRECCEVQLDCGSENSLKQNSFINTPHGSYFLFNVTKHKFYQQ